MKHPSMEEQREIVRQREETGRELSHMRQEALRGLPYNWEDMDTLLSLCDDFDEVPSHKKSRGLVEM